MGLFLKLCVLAFYQIPIGTYEVLVSGTYVIIIIALLNVL